MNGATGDGLIYIHEDVVVRPGRVGAYLANQGTTWPFSDIHRYDLVAMLGQLRPFGRWPRAVNIWEADWARLWNVLGEQYSEPVPAAPEAPPTVPPPDAAFDAWWRRSAVDREGGWDRFMRPGPGCPALVDLQHGEPRPCVVQQVIRLRSGAQTDVLAWIGEVVRPAIADTGWRPLLWLGAVHGSNVTVLLGAPVWDGVLDLARALPALDPSWDAVVTTSALQAWGPSRYLERPQ